MYVCVGFQALPSTPAQGSISSQLGAMSAALSQLIVDYASQALFNADRLAFAMHLAYSLVPHLFQPTEWDVFLGNAVGKTLSLLCSVQQDASLVGLCLSKQICSICHLQKDCFTA